MTEQHEGQEYQDSTQEFLDNAGRMLERLDSFAGDTQQRIEGWLVGISVGLLALPALLGTPYVPNSVWEWRWFVVGKIALVLCVLCVLLRNGAALARAVLQARIVRKLELLIKKERANRLTKQEDDDAKKELERRQEIAMRFWRAEIPFLGLAYGAFFVGILALAVVGLLRSQA